MMVSPKYEILSEIGRGGMGVVYKVRHTSLETISALKILPSHLAEDQELIARFHREARVMAQLRHSNIVRVLDVDREGDVYYFVMEYVEGRSLSALLAAEGRRSLAETIETVTQVARAVAYAHAQRPAVIHRDLKPSNILLETESGRAIVTDFGLAKLAGGMESLRTESGKFIGTLRYCAPEQLTGSSEVDERVDVYALGMVLYEVYAGRSAYFDLEQPKVVAGLLQLGLPHPFRFDRDTPDEFRRIVVRATEKDRERRYPSVALLVQDLASLGASTRGNDAPTLPGGESGHTAASQQAPESRPFSRVIIAATAGSIALAIGAGLIFRDTFSNGPRVERGNVGGSAASSVLSVAAGPAAAPEPQTRKSISVMDFSTGSPETASAWMRDAIRDNLNSRLSRSPDCKVFSKEFIDFKAQQMVREGKYSDVKAATMEVAQTLGVTKAVLGSYRVERDRLHIEAHLVDMGTGVQDASETVDGEQADFAGLQAALAGKLMARLGVSAPVGEEPAVRSAASSGDMERYRLLLQAEGSGTAPEAPSQGPGGKPAKERHGKMQRLERLLGRVVTVAAEHVVSTARADDSAPEDPSSEGAIRETLEKYRRAYEQKDLVLLSAVYERITPAQIEANRKYFADARELAVSLEDIDVAVGQEEAAVSYTRHDRFIDDKTQQPVDVEVRLTKILVRVDGAWKFAGDRK